MPAPILMLPGKVNANNALVVVVQASTSLPAASNGAPSNLAMLPGKVDASNRLLVKFI